MTERRDAKSPARAAGVPDDALEEINRLWTIVRAFSNTAHDVNNALQIISGNAELLQAGELSPEIARRVDTIRHQTARAAAVVDRLVQYVRSRSGPPQPMDVWPLVETAVQLRAASANRSRILITVDRRDGRSCQAMVDGTRTLQALLDLLLEAEGRLSGRSQAKILIRVEDDQNTVVVTVEASAGSPSTPDVHASPGTAAASVTIETQVPAASYLAASQGGSMQIAASAQGHILKLTLPAVRRQA